MTDHVLSFLSAYQGTLAEAFSLPSSLSNEYVLFDCLKEAQEKSTYLLRKKTDNSFAVLKTARGGAREQLRAEYEILNTLRSPAFPQALSYFSDQQSDYFLRSHVAGTPVFDSIERNGPFSEAEAIRLVLGLCSALSILHEQNPPVIHRDIKPQNVIFTHERTLALIDFDAARRFQIERKNDTVCLGTQATAAPEQFGYQQTDQRADIYSTGILLLYLCTGSYETQDRARIHSRALRRVIEKSTRFDPARRYPNIREFCRDLRLARQSFSSAASFWRGAALGLFAGVGISAALALTGAVTLVPQKVIPDDGTSQQAAVLPAEEQQAVFESPEIERAVREHLGVSAETPLYQADLDRVSTLYICGPASCSYWSEVTDYALYRSNSENGTVATLADIPKLRNLTELALCNQSIIDVSPLRDMRLTRLALNGNLIIDPSPLSSLTLLRELYIGYNPLTQIDFVKSLPLLQAIDLSSTSISDLTPLSNDMTRICLNDAPILDYSPLMRMNTLQELFINHPNQECLGIVSQLHDLTRLEIGTGLTSVEPVLGLTNLASLVLAPTKLNSIEGIQTLKHVTYFRICAASDLDLTPLTQMESLETVDIFNQTMSDYTILFKIPNLQHLYCGQLQKDKIEALGLPIPFEIHVV